MNIVSKWLEDRRVGQTTVTISSEGKPVDPASILMRHGFFTGMVTKYDLSLYTTEGAQITLRGQNRNIRKFNRDYEVADRLGLV